jgi:hypothetical protein
MSPPLQGWKPVERIIPQAARIAKLPRVRFWYRDLIFRSSSLQKPGGEPFVGPTLDHNDAGHHFDVRWYPFMSHFGKMMSPFVSHLRKMVSHLLSLRVPTCPVPPIVGSFHASVCLGIHIFRGDRPSRNHFVKPVGSAVGISSSGRGPAVGSISGVWARTAAADKRNTPPWAPIGQVTASAARECGSPPPDCR